MQQKQATIPASLAPLAEKVQALKSKSLEGVKHVVVGLDDVAHQLLIALVAGGHVLMEGVPGTAKTTLCKTFARLLGVEFQRIQFTPDLLPSDVTGTYIYDRQKSEFVLRRGPIFCQVLLADELNRAPAKTQSALLEAMQESQVTIEGTTLKLPHPFLVLATQNPIEQEGVYRLPEAQLDRFLLRVEVGYPQRTDEIDMLEIHGSPAHESEPFTSPEEVVEIQQHLQHIHAANEIREYIVDLARETRQHPEIALGASPRAALYLMHAARARSLLDGRTYVTHADVQEVLLPVLGHRLILRPEAEVEGRHVREVDPRVHGESPGDRGMIATARVRWILLVAVVATFVGVLSYRALIAQLGLALILWVGYHWVVFRYRVDLALRRAATDRRLSDRAGLVSVLWENRVVHIDTRIDVPSGLGLTTAEIVDRIPQGAEITEGTNVASVVMGRRCQVAISYSLRPKCIGVLRFEGVHLTLTDLQGLFTAQRFLPIRQLFRVLPPLIGTGTRAAVHKRHNQLPPPGIHRHLRPGMGSELLEIRDYIPGDPPRSIAWKVSARRDCLMSKQFESEVPVRCTLMVDASRSVRIGYPGPNDFSTLVRLAATVVETTIAHRDPVGLSLFDAHAVQIVRPAANRQTAVRILDMLAGAAGRAIEPADVVSDEFLPVAFRLASEVYPQTLDWSRVVLRRWWPLPRRRTKRQRLQLAAVLAAHYELGSSGLAMLVQDDRSFSQQLQRFLAEHQVPYPGPLLDKRGRFLFADADKVQNLTKLLTAAVSHGHDNELFVLLADLLDMDECLAPLLKAIRVATARHHRVLIVCAWPTGMPPPSEQGANVLDEMPLKPSAELIRAADQQHRAAAYLRLRRDMAKLRVPVVCATDSVATATILSQIELIRESRITK